jgi:transposase
MRGMDVDQNEMFFYGSLDERVRADHPLRPLREMCNRALRQLSPKFDELYSPLGRESVPPEQLIRALLLQALYSVRSERQLMDRLELDLLFRWFVGLGGSEPAWDATVFSKNRDRLLEGEIAQEFFQAVLGQAREKDLLSSEHFSVDGTLLEAWASKKSYGKKQEPPEQGSGARGRKLLRDTHESATDPDAKMYRKSTGGAFQLCHMAHVLMENRNGIPVAGKVTEAKNSAEWEAGLEMLQAMAEASSQRITVGADSAYDYAVFTEAARDLRVTPHVAQHQLRSSSIDGRTTRHDGCEISLKKRRWIEPIFGWVKNVAMQRQVRHRGRALVQWNFLLALSGYVLVRMRNLAAAA